MTRFIKSGFWLIYFWTGFSPSKFLQPFSYFSGVSVSLLLRVFYVQSFVLLEVLIEKNHLFFTNPLLSEVPDSFADIFSPMPPQSLWPSCWRSLNRPSSTLFLECYYFFHVFLRHISSHKYGERRKGCTILWVSPDAHKGTFAAASTPAAIYPSVTYLTP